MAGIEYEVERHVGIISETEKGWTKEVNLISWNGRTAKYDIRDWAPNHEKAGKGITLTEEEVIKLKEILNTI